VPRSRCSEHRQFDVAEDGLDARFDAKGFGRAARCELALQPAVSVAKRSASLCSICGVGLTCKGFMYFSFPRTKIQNFQ